MLNKKELEKIRDALDNCKRPLFLFDDDPDGLCSFLLLYRYVNEGQGIVVKTSKNISQNFKNKVINYGPDVVFILDVPDIEQEFIDVINQHAKIIIIDHHTPKKIIGADYYNPKTRKDTNYPVSLLCYQIVNEDLWISVLGTAADWVRHPNVNEFRKSFPDLLPK